MPKSDVTDRPLAPSVLKSEELVPYVLNRLMSEMSRAWMDTLRPHGLTAPRWQVLAVLSLFDGSRVGTIAEMSGSDQPQVSRIIDQMQRDSLVERRPSEDDSRVVEVWLTAKGRALYNKLLPHARDYVGRLFRNFKRGEMDQLLTLLERLLRDIAPVSDQAAPERTPRG